MSLKIHEKVSSSLRDPQCEHLSNEWRAPGLRSDQFLRILNGLYGLSFANSRYFPSEYHAGDEIVGSAAASVNDIFPGS